MLTKLFRPRRSARRGASVCLGLEALESRYCPSPTLTLTPVLLPNHQVQLSGQVTDPNPASVNITFSGAATGSTTADSAGNYRFITSNASLGAVSAVGVDGQNQSTNTATATITDNLTITLKISVGRGKTVTLTGQVNDVDPGGLVVSFSGQAGGSTVTAADGSYSYTTTAAGLGNITATVVDEWFDTAAATAAIPNKAPQIVNFTASQGQSFTYTFTGQVVDEWAPGLVVTLNGIPPRIANVQVTVDPTGAFTWTVQLPAGEGGTVTAQTTDWWGVASNVASITFNNT